MTPTADNRAFPEASSAGTEQLRPLVITTILRATGNTGVQTHVSQLLHYVDRDWTPASVVTPFSWGGTLAMPVFGVRLPLRWLNRAAGVMWYRHWHEAFLYRALRRHLIHAGVCTVYAQEPVAARAALRARQGAHQRVVMAVHFRTSQADEWANKHEIRSGGAAFRAMRRFEERVIPQLDGLVYVSRWAKEALLSWLPEADAVPSTVIGNFVASHAGDATGSPHEADLVTTGHLEPVKNHRYLLRVLAEANRAGHRLTLDVYGDGPLRRDLQRLVSSLGVDGQVRFRGFCPDVRDHLPRYRAYVHASYSESSSFAIIEAMAAGLPVFAGRIDALTELFHDGVEGRFWSLDDPAEAATTLVGLIGSEPVRQAAGKAAHERFRSTFDSDTVVPKLLGFLAG
jgi:glycosyltransferase involved in cell wall biosynthesis